MPHPPFLEQNLEALVWFLIRRNLAAVMPSRGRLEILRSSFSMNRFTISAMVRVLIASPRSDLLFRSTNFISASSSASSSPALLGSGNLPFGCFRTKRWRCLVSGLLK